VCVCVCVSVLCVRDLLLENIFSMVVPSVIRTCTPTEEEWGGDTQAMGDMRYRYLECVGLYGRVYIVCESVWVRTTHYTDTTLYMYGRVYTTLNMYGRVYNMYGRVYTTNYMYGRVYIV